MKTLIKRVVLFTCIILIWGICSRNANPLFVPDPKVVFENLIASIQSGQLWMAIKYSFLRITTASLLSATIAFPVALLVYNSRIAKDIFNPIISMMRYIPVTAFYPLLIMWFGIDELMKD